MDATLHVRDVNHVLYSIMPYDLVPYAVSAFYASYHELPDGRDTQVITLTHLFDTLDLFTRGHFQRVSIFDRLSGCLAGMRVADFEVLDHHSQAVLARV
jgi:hypothetical protein